ncbi:hypothetical protein ACHAXS_003366 [Conticribra weissflogii]
MSIYSDSSDSYWKERQKKNPKSTFSIACVCILGFLAVAGSFYYHQRKRNSAEGVLSQRRSLHETSDVHWKQCETRVNSRQECTSICQPERNSIQRKTMHQACLHGCQTAHVASTALGCRGKEESAKSSRRVVSEEDAMQEIGVLAFDHCSKFQGVEPKPDVFATCRKYHRAGTKQGFRMGIDAMKNVLDEEWAGIKTEQ